MRINKLNFVVMMLSLIAVMVTIKTDSKILFILNTGCVLLNAYFAFDNEGKR